jgi:23S rRNA U2552 (ribose-2'-O)-methylase RlmE/FtsJ
MPFENGAKILDLGCGPGTWIMVIKKNLERKM